MALGDAHTHRHVADGGGIVSSIVFGGTHKRWCQVYGVLPLLPGKIVILFAVSVTKVKCILRSKVLLQPQVNNGNTGSR
jgi:hypothetical protein